MTVGMKIMRPTSIAKTGASSTASIRAAGGVEFDLCATLSLNGVFTSDFDDYMIVVAASDTGAGTIGGRLRSSGSDATGADYASQQLNASSTTVSAVRTTGDTKHRILYLDGDGGGTIHVYGPALAQPTALRLASCGGTSSARIVDFASTHSLSTAYDGFTFSIFNDQGYTISGLVTVYGLAQ